ncbi:3531_t:CDS:1, partial [Dentiscutata heterogama]
LKYLVPRTSQVEIPKVLSDQQQSESSSPKKRKTLLFTQLLTCKKN